MRELCSISTILRSVWIAFFLCAPPPSAASGPYLTPFLCLSPSLVLQASFPFPSFLVLFFFTLSSHFSPLPCVYCPPSRIASSKPLRAHALGSTSTPFKPQTLNLLHPPLHFRLYQPKKLCHEIVVTSCYKSTQPLLSLLLK